MDNLTTGFLILFVIVVIIILVLGSIPSTVSSVDQDKDISEKTKKKLNIFVIFGLLLVSIISFVTILITNI